MRAALLHLDLAAGPEAANLGRIARGVEAAATAGARWVLTPETALQGYFFTDGNPAPALETQPAAALSPLLDAIRRLGVTLFLGCADLDPETGAAHNSMVVFAPDGRVLGRHRKLVAHGGAEAWSKAGSVRRPIAVDGIEVGVMICADAWFPEHPRAMKDAGAELLTLSAAWPPRPMGPDGCWERDSAATGLGMWVCNQTGRHRMDLTEAESAVIANGHRRLTHAGAEPAVLVFDWDFAKGDTTSADFLRIPAA